MIKNYFIGLCIVILASCSATNDDNIQNFGESKNLDLSTEGFRGDVGVTIDDELPSNGIYFLRTASQNPIYGFYSSHTNKHLYSHFSIANMLPRTQPGEYYYFLERFLGSASGKGKEITAWFNVNNEDLLLTTTPEELDGQNGWRKDDDLGKSYNGDEPGSFPIYRYYRQKTSSHFYTRDRNELGDGKFGFVYEGIAFYLKNETTEQELRQVHDGLLMKDKTTGYLYIIIEGRIRILETMEVANRVFGVKDGNYYPEVNIDELIGPRGKIVNAGAKLIEDTRTGKIYFLDNGLLRYIPDHKTLRVYMLNEKAIEKINGVVGFTGPDLTVKFPYVK